MKATYKIIKLLGEGSFGKAYLAKTDKDDKKYVIKQIIMDGMTDQEKRDTFNEAVILKKLDHPNIIKFKEVFLQRKPQEALNIVTEFCDGGDLGQKIDEQKKTKERFPESQILDYITQICLALQHVHKKKIIHRDLKSGNVFLMQSGIIKLGDFGIAKVIKSKKAQTMVGTPYYLSPEIISSMPYDDKSDIWALGVLLYELMTFKMPFSANSLPLLKIKINRGVFKPPPNAYSTEIRDLLNKCLTLKPEQRPSINEILNLPLIKDRINNFLKEVQYDQDLSKTMVKKYKDKKKEEKHKKKKENEEKKEVNTPASIAPSTANNTIKSAKDEKTETKKMVSDKNKITAVLNKKKGKKQKEEAKPASNTLEKKHQAETSSSNNSTKKSLNQTNFLIQKNDPNFQMGKQYKEDEIGKTLKAKGYKDLLDDKSGSFDVNKLNEDQYNQLRLLNNLHNVANNLAQDSDSEISVTSSTSSLPSKGEGEIMFDDISFKDVPKEKVKEAKDILKEKLEQNKDEIKEIEEIKKEIEKEIGNDLLKEVMDLLDKSCDKNAVEFDRELIIKKVSDLSGKGFDKSKLDKAVEKIDEIFAVLMKDRAIV